MRANNRDFSAQTQKNQDMLRLVEKNINPPYLFLEYHDLSSSIINMPIKALNSGENKGNQTTFAVWFPSMVLSGDLVRIGSASR